MNKVILTGNLVRDPEVRYTQTGKAVASFSIAVSKGYKKNENGQYPPSDFFNIVAWEKRAEFCGKYLTKGTRILIEGRLQSRTYDAQDGTKRYITEVVADEIEFAGGRRQDGGEGGGYSSNNNNYRNDNSSRPPEPDFGGNDNDMIDNRAPNDKDDIDVPF